MEPRLNDDDFRLLLNFLNRPWKGYRKVRKGVMRRIRRHMQALNTPFISDYLQLLQENPLEHRRLTTFLQITISRFFRDRVVWNELREHILPELAARFPTGLAAWSAGCSCGEEPYSLAILWEQLQLPVPLKIYATDINPICLERARSGVYPASSLREVSEQVRSNYFTPLKGGRYFVISPGPAQLIQWRRHDFFSEPLQGPFNLILLRNNLLTYHQDRERQQALNSILSRLVPGGYLIVGSHERLPAGETLPMRRVQGVPIYFRPPCPG